MRRPLFLRGSLNCLEACDDRLGKIAEGYLADFTVLSASPLEAKPEDIKSITVKRTVVNGRDSFVAGN